MFKGKDPASIQDNDDMDIKKTAHPFGKLLESHPQCKSEI